MTGAVEFIICAVLAMLLAPLPAPGQAAIPPAITVQRINLMAFEWQQAPNEHRGEFDDVANNQVVAIDARGRVVVGFTTRDSSRQLATRSQPSWHFHLLRFSTGAMPDLSLQVPTNNWRRNGVYLSDRDDIIVRANDQILLTAQASSPSGGARDWQRLALCGPDCVIAQSLGRRTIYIASWDAHSVTVISLDGPKSRQCPAMRGAPPELISITDDYAYWNHDLGNPPYPPPVLYRWPFCDVAERTTLPISADAIVYPLNDLSLLFSPYSPSPGEPIEYDIASINGSIEARIKPRLAKHESASAVLSQNAGRLALEAYTLRGGVSWLDISPHLVAERVLVLSLKDGRELASFPVVPPNFGSQLAIGPDGHKVAVLAGSNLLIADIP